MRSHRAWQSLAHRKRIKADVAVADTGIGIPAEELGQVLTRFHRASKVPDARFESAE